MGSFHSTAHYVYANPINILRVHNPRTCTTVSLNLSACLINREHHISRSPANPHFHLLQVKSRSLLHIVRTRHPPLKTSSPLLDCCSGYAHDRSTAKPQIAKPNKRDGTVASAPAVFGVEIGDGDAATVVVGVMVVIMDKLLEVVVLVAVVLSAAEVVGVSGAALAEGDAVEIIDAAVGIVDIVAEDADGVAAAAAVDIVVNIGVVEIAGGVAVNGTAVVQ